jgi:hypothetical protein
VPTRAGLCLAVGVAHCVSFNKIERVRAQSDKSSWSPSPTFCTLLTPIGPSGTRPSRYDGLVRRLPKVVADLTFTSVLGGRAVVPPGCWEQHRPPVVGELVLVADGGAGPYEATATGIEQDGSLVLAVHAFVPAHA